MQVKVLKEAGYEEALLGLSLSFYDHKMPLVDWNVLDVKYVVNPLEYHRSIVKNDWYFWTDEKYKRAAHRAKALAFKGGGHNKFLESITVWLYIQAPRCWWSEYDTYRVGMTKNSSSTMHTLDKREVEALDFEEGVSEIAIREFNYCLEQYKNPLSMYYKDITRLKLNLPEGWLQERQITTNYMTLQNILNQREGHRLRFWNTHRDELLAQLSYPELLIPEE